MNKNKLLLLLPLALALLSGCKNDESSLPPVSNEESVSTTLDSNSDEVSTTDLTTEESSISTSDSGESSDSAVTSTSDESSEEEQSSADEETSDSEQNSDSENSEDELVISASWPTAEISAFAALVNASEVFPHVELARVIHHGVYDHTPTYGHYHLNVVSSDLNDFEVIKTAYNNAGYDIEINGDNFSGMSSSYNSLIQGAYFADDATYGDMFTVDIYIYPTY